ncbi:hypothetical protein CRE_30146 [Caenorhabditis remanei]|uniref:INSulin related n=1 Tax=Caenorhabditis remanei TaxID=31234 RepID=E3NAJ0_CAERE|nr:hypothetical protein CRE_30146 [Caenorhabditis remanei]
MSPFKCMAFFFLIFSLLFVSTSGASLKKWCGRHLVVRAFDVCGKECPNGEMLFQLCTARTKITREMIGIVCCPETH